MPRRIRCIMPGIPHHVIQRGNNRQNVFIQKHEYEFFLKHLKEYATENDVEIGAYCLMSNHIHLMLFPKTSEGLIQLMKSVLQKYSQFFNRKYKRTGKIWGNRYKLNIVEPESAWIIARYIDRNPLRAGIVKKAEKYDYSSAATHLLGKEDQIITEDVIKGRKEEYIEFFNAQEANTDKHLSQIRTIIQQQKAVGSREFLAKLKQKFQLNFEPRGRGRPKK